MSEQNSSVQGHLLVDKASLSKIRKLIRTDLVKAGARPSAVFDCLVAVTEACSSALQGRGEKSGDPSKIAWIVQRGRAEFCIEDFSREVEPPDGIPRRRLHEVLEEETGLRNLGDDVIQNLMDEVTIEEKATVKTTTMVKHLR